MITGRPVLSTVGRFFDPPVTRFHSASRLYRPGARLDSFATVEAVESGGIYPIGKFHAVIKEERAEVLSEIDKERKATLAYLTQERSAVMDELEKELNRLPIFCGCTTVSSDLSLCQRAVNR